MTMTLISTVTVGSGGAASIDFTSISGTYTDLKLVVSARSDGSEAFGILRLEPNGSSANLSCRYIYGYGSGQGSIADSYITSYVDGGAATSNTFGNAEIYIPNYSGSTNKSFSIDSVTENNASDGRQMLTAGLWTNTAAITSLKLTVLSGGTPVAKNFVQYSTASLYGILKGSGGATVS